MPSYDHGFNVVGLLPGFFAVILAPKVIRLSNDGIYPENACNGVILILLWYVRLHNHVECSSASVQNSVPSLAEYIIHLILSFNVQLGRSTIPFCDDESAAVELTSHPCELQTFVSSRDLDNPPPPSVVIVASTWSGSRSPKKSMPSSVDWSIEPHTVVHGQYLRKLVTWLDILGLVALINFGGFVETK
jgi:hypothetical protein